MIAMMYLVLTALLALNISKDILVAFVLVNNSIENTVSSFGTKNEQLYADFAKAKSVDPVKVTPYWKKAEQTRAVAKNLQDYIDSLKTLIVMQTEGLEKSEADTINLENLEKKGQHRCSHKYPHREF